jgi:methylmalonyl-CoA/ethylmalonyl-CoA epimerase
VIPELVGYELHHVGIVVSDIDAAASRYAALGFDAGERFEIPEQRVIAITYQAGPGFVELIQPTDTEGPIAKFMAKRGEGMHHVAYRVHDLEGILCRLAAAGVRLIDTTPRTGAHGVQLRPKSGPIPIS